MESCVLGAIGTTRFDVHFKGGHDTYSGKRLSSVNPRRVSQSEKRSQQSGISMLLANWFAQRCMKPAAHDSKCGEVTRFSQFNIRIRTGSGSKQIEIGFHSARMPENPASHLGLNVGAVSDTFAIDR